jgi:GT2 family glycosyltransferase
LVGYRSGVRAERAGDPVLDPYEGSTNATRIERLKGARSLRTASMAPGLTVAVPNLDRADLIVPLANAAADLASGLAERGLGFELLIGDTGSSDREVLALLDAPPDGVVVVRDMTYQFSRTNNDLCDARVHYDHLLLLNNDVLLRTPDPLLGMLECLQRDPEVGIVGAVLDFPDGTLQHGGIDLVRSGPWRGLPIHLGARTRRPHSPGSSWPAIAVTGAALMIRTKLWQDLGGLDEQYERECQDVDLCLRAHRLGWHVRVVDVGPLVHEENGTRPKGEEDWPDRRLFLRRWTSYLEAVFL